MLGGLFMPSRLLYMSQSNNLHNGLFTGRGAFYMIFLLWLKEIFLINGTLVGKGIWLAFFFSSPAQIWLP